MSLPWIIELELPSGTFSTSQLAEPIPVDELNAEIAQSYAILRVGPLLSVPPPAATDNIDLDSSPATSTLHLLLGYFHLEYVMIEICTALSKLVADPTQPWSDKEIDDMKEIFRRYYANRPAPDDK